MHKVKKKLQKVEGVYKVSIDAEQGRVIVSGNADPASLIEKLEKAGKHAELWGGPQKGGPAPVPVFISNEQLKKFQMESINKNGKKGNEQQQQQKNGNGFVHIPQEKGFKDDKLFSGKDNKSVRFSLPEDEDDDEEFDEDDDEFDDEEDYDDDEFDDEFGEGGFDAHKPPAKAAAAAGVGHKPSKAAPNAHHKGGKDGKPKKGGGGGGGGMIDVFLKGMLKKASRKNGDSGKKSKKKGENKKEDGGKNGGKKGGFELGDLKKGKNDDGWSKKGGENFDGGKQQGFNEMKANHKGGGGGRNMDMMGQKGGLPAVAGMPMPAMNNPYSQQQYMAHLMMMNQQRENGHGAYHPSAYARPPPPAMSYGPPPGMVYGPPPPMSYGPPPATTEQYTHMFSDENTDSCSIM